MAINEKKITKAQMFTALSVFLADQNDDAKVLATFSVGEDDKAEQVSLTIGDAIVGLSHEIELLGNKSKKSGSSKKTEAQQKMETELLSYMADFPNELFTTTTLIKRVPEFDAYPDPVTPQKVTPRLGAMEKEGKVSKTKEKGKTLWKYVAQDEFEEEEDEA